MQGKTIRIPARLLGSLVLLLAMVTMWTLFDRSGIAPVAANQPSQPAASGVTGPQVVPQATPGQDFEDVYPSNTFYSYLHNLKLAGIVSGYNCVAGGTTDPCVPPDNLPYYHPGVGVTRLQMTKFIDLGRRNIAD